MATKQFIKRETNDYTNTLITRLRDDREKLKDKYPSPIDEYLQVKKET